MERTFPHHTVQLRAAMYVFLRTRGYRHGLLSRNAMVRPLSGKVEAQCNLIPTCLFFYPFIVLPGLFTGPDRVTHERVFYPAPSTPRFRHTSHCCGAALPIWAKLIGPRVQR